MSTKFTWEEIDTEVLVVGGGLAGSYAAIKAKEYGNDVLLVDKSYVGRSGASTFAAGTINIFFPEEDDWDAWFKEIIERGEYLNDQEWVDIYLKEALPRAEEFEKWGQEVGEDLFVKSEGRFKRVKARGNINTSSCIIRALPMMNTLRKKLISTGVKLVERTMITHLFMNEGKVSGVFGFNYRENKFYVFKAKSVILANSGCGFKSFFIGHRNLTGEGQAMAYEAGAVLRNLDQAMSNTTAKQVDLHGLSLMVGSGARFLNSAGEEFMWKYEPKVGNRARLTKLTVAFCKEVDEGRGPIYIDLRNISMENRKLIREIVPEGLRSLESMGIKPFEELIEWIPAFEGTLVHGGGLHIDYRCSTNIPGLFAVGDSTCTPVHGTWSVTGINLSFCLISGERAARFATEYNKNPDTGLMDIDGEEVRSKINEFIAPLLQIKGIDPDTVIYKLQEIILNYKVLYIRTEERLKEALAQIEEIENNQLPLIKVSDSHNLVKAFECRSMLLIAKMVVNSVLGRKESRGFVYREDYPQTDNSEWLKWINVKKENNQIKTYAEDFPMPYYKPELEVKDYFEGGGDAVGNSKH